MHFTLRDGDRGRIYCAVEPEAAAQAAAGQALPSPSDDPGSDDSYFGKSGSDRCTWYPRSFRCAALHAPRSTAYEPSVTQTRIPSGTARNQIQRGAQWLFSVRAPLNDTSPGSAEKNSGATVAPQRRQCGAAAARCGNAAQGLRRGGRHLQCRR